MKNHDLRGHIIAEIKRIAAEKDGHPPGWNAFSAATAISQNSWRGVFWAKWSDAVREAGFEPNSLTNAIPEEALLSALADATRELGRVPSEPELQLLLRQKNTGVKARTVFDRLAPVASMRRKLKDYCLQSPDYRDVCELMGEAELIEDADDGDLGAVGWVYLLQSGNHFKIGRSEEVERRVKSIATAMPEKTVLVHAIRTDDPSGIEAYWHRRFADRRANGEWFKLTPKDVAAFKKRKFQ